MKTVSEINETLKETTGVTIQDLLLAQSEEDAKKYCDQLGLTLVVTRRDDEILNVVTNVNPSRLKVELDSGRITEVQVG